MTFGTERANVPQATRANTAKRSVTQVVLDQTAKMNANVKVMPRVIMSMVAVCVIQGSMDPTVNTNVLHILLVKTASFPVFVITEEPAIKQPEPVPAQLVTKEIFANLRAIMVITAPIALSNACAPETQFVIRKQVNVTVTPVSLGACVTSNAPRVNTALVVSMIFVMKHIILFMEHPTAHPG